MEYPIRILAGAAGAALPTLEASPSFRVLQTADTWPEGLPRATSESLDGGETGSADVYPLHCSGSV